MAILVVRSFVYKNTSLVLDSNNKTRAQLQLGLACLFVYMTVILLAYFDGRSIVYSIPGPEPESMLTNRVYCNWQTAFQYVKLLNSIAI